MSSLQFVKAQCFLKKVRIFRLKFEKTIVAFGIITLEFLKMQSFMQKQKCLDLGQKVPHLGLFLLEIEKAIVIFKINTLSAQNMKFFIKNFFSKCDQISRKLRVWSHLL